MPGLDFSSKPGTKKQPRPEISKTSSTTHKNRMFHLCALCASVVNKGSHFIKWKFDIEMPERRAPMMPRKPWSVPQRKTLGAVVRPSLILSGEP